MSLYERKINIIVCVSQVPDALEVEVISPHQHTEPYVCPGGGLVCADGKHI
jgi:hypothetical protein